MKKSLFVTLMLASAIFVTSLYAKTAEESLDQTVAVVNDDIITKSELNSAINASKSQITQEHIAMPAEKVLQKQVLEQLINTKIQLQAARQSGVNITDAELEKAIETIAERNHVTVNGLYDRLNQDGLSVSDYRNEMRDQLTMQKLQQQEVASKLTVTPQEVTAFLRTRSWQNNSAKEYRIEDILIATSDTPSPQEIASAKQRAEMILDKIHNGENFDKEAQAESAGKNALQGGDLGWRKLAEIPSAFAAQVVAMQKNDVAGPIQTPNGFHLIRLTDVRSTGSNGAAPNRKMVENLLLQQKFEQAVQNWVSKLRSEAFITMNDSDLNRNIS